MKIILFASIALLIISLNVNAQSTRSLVNEGVDLYKQGKFSESEVNFKKGLEKESENFESNFNVGSAYYKQGRYDEAVNSFNSALSKTDDNFLKSKVYHNMGNSLLKSQKVKESIQAYKNALKLNPNDSETKYNLSYALSLLDQQQNQQSKNDKQKDQNKDQQQNKNDQNKDQKNQDQQKNQQQDAKDQSQQTQQDNLKQQQNKMSKEEAERILQALKNNETEIQKKLRKKIGVPVKTEKDW